MKQNPSKADVVLQSLLGHAKSEGVSGELETGGKLVLPVVEEQAEVRKLRVETGKVQIEKLISERTEIIDEPLLREQVSVERITINRVVSEPMPIRYEGDTMIVPLLEEVMVVTKRLMLKEELHITRRQTTVHEPQQVTLRREEAHVKRDGAELAKQDSLIPSKQEQADSGGEIHRPLQGVAAASQPAVDVPALPRKPFEAPGRTTPAPAPKAVISKPRQSKVKDDKKSKVKNKNKKKKG